MATQPATIDFLTDQLGNLPTLRSRRMFGEYCLYYNDKVVALVCDDQLFIKPTPGSDRYLDDSHGAPPYPGAKNYLCVPEEMWEDREWLADFIRYTADQLPAPKPKSAGKKKNQK